MLMRVRMSLLSMSSISCVSSFLRVSLTTSSTTGSGRWASQASRAEHSAGSSAPTSSRVAGSTGLAGQDSTGGGLGGGRTAGSQVLTMTSQQGGGRMCLIGQSLYRGALLAGRGGVGRDSLPVGRTGWGPEFTLLVGRQLAVQGGAGGQQRPRHLPARHLVQRPRLHLPRHPAPYQVLVTLLSLRVCISGLVNTVVDNVVVLPAGPSPPVPASSQVCLALQSV